MILSTPVIPETITVHLGPPASYARNVTVPFKEYIANMMYRNNRTRAKACTTRFLVLGQSPQLI